MKELCKKYYELDQFFSGYFPEADFDNLSDEDVIEAYRKEAKTEKIQKLISLIEMLIIEIADYWKDVKKSANRYFENQDEAIEWLKMVKREMSK